jgi:hypothetical protein
MPPLPRATKAFSTVLCLAALLLAGLLLAGPGPAAAQSVSEVQPSNPYPGHPVRITGSGLSGTSGVSYDGSPVDFRGVSDTEVRARVPAGASTGASFEVATGGGTATSSQVTLDTDPGLYGPRRALAFDGADDYVATGAGGDALGLADESFSIGVWFKARGFPKGAGSVGLVGMDGEAPNETLHLALKSGGSVRFGFYGNDLDSPDGTVKNGRWTRLTFVYDASTGDRFIYRNGEQVASDNSGPNFQGTAELLIGRWGGNRHVNALIDQVRVWKGALSQAQVRERAHRTVGPGDAAFGDLEAAYRFDAPGASAAFEQTANYRFGTLNGGPTRQAFSGARVGQEAVSTTGADAAVGPSGGALAATGVSAGPDGAIQLYRYGAPDGPRRSDGQPGEAIDGTQTNQRSNLTWGAATNGSPSATLTIDYSSVQGVSSPVHLIRRDGPETAWGNADDWTHDSNAQTFTITGTVPEGEYAVKTGPIRSRVYVDADAGTGGDGTSWSNAYSDLQAAIDNAPPGSEIWVAEGVYTPDGEGDSFTITGAKDPLGVYGGFAGTESSRGERRPTVHRTVLSGDIAGDDTDPDGDGIVEDADPDQDGMPENLVGGENANHVLFLNGGAGERTNVADNITPATVLDGLVVTAGQADVFGTTREGGGLYCDGGGAGNACSPTITGVVFAGNAAEQNGGAIFNDGQDGGTSSPHIRNTVFAGNAASRGGAMYNNGVDAGRASPAVANVVFTGNAAIDFGGAMYNNAFEGAASPSIVNATFTGNVSDIGGAVYNDGEFGESSPQIVNTVLWGNRAGRGSEIYNNFEGATPTVEHTIIEGGLSGIGSTGPASTTDGGGNSDRAPRFVDASIPAGPDGVFATADDGLNVKAGSPAFDAGTNGALPAGVSTDITGADRTQDQSADGTPTVNIGAYEALSTNLPGAPFATTRAVQGVTGTRATVEGIASAAGLKTVAQVQYFPTSAPSSVRSVSVDASPLSEGDYTPRQLALALSGLSPDTEYTARLVATNREGGASSSSVTFTTAAGYARTISGRDGTGNDAGWRMLALPAAGKTRAALEDDLALEATGGSVLYRWDSASQSWAAQDAATDALPRGEGFMLYFFDDFIDPLERSGLSLDVSTGSEDQGADETVDGLAQDGRFHLVGNPFDAAFDLSGLAGGDLAAAGFQATVQVWDPETGSYRQITQGSTGDEIAAWQGLFVERTTVGSGQTTLAFAASAKQGGPGPLVGSRATSPIAGARSGGDEGPAAASQAAAPQTAAPQAAAPRDGSRAAAAGPRARVNLSMVVTQEAQEATPPAPRRDSMAPATARAERASTRAAAVDTVERGRLALRFSEAGTPGWDAYEATQQSDPYGAAARAGLSAPLLRSAGSGASGQTLVRRALASEPVPSEPVRIPVSVQATGVGGEAMIVWPDAAHEKVPAGWVVELIDANTGERTNLRTGAHSFPLADGDGTGLSAPGDSRFELRVGPGEPLPVELARLEASATEEGARLTWQTASETGHAGFAVERKALGTGGAPSTASHWQKVGFVAANAAGGTASGASRYRFTDRRVPFEADSLRYRLRQVDTDGTARVSRSVAVRRSAQELRLLGTAPNPARRRTRIRYALPAGAHVRIGVYDVLGRQVRRVVQSRREAGRHAAAASLEGLASGTYFVRLQAGGRVRTERLTVVR